MAADGTVKISIDVEGKQAEKSVKGLRGLFEGLGGYVKKTTSRIGDMVKAFGIVKVGQAAFNLLKNSMDGAIKRLDTLRSSDKVFANMGFSVEETTTMMDNLNDSISGLPTPLDQAVSGVQLLSSSTGDLLGSEKIYSAMNNAILGFGGDTEMVNNAVLQLSQGLADNKINGETLNSMMNSQMGPTLRAIADMMGITMGELKSGLSDGSIAVDDFIDTLVTLNEEGGGGLESLQQIAQDATGGIQTSMANMRTAVSRGLANMIDAIDEALVAANFPSIGEMISNVGSVIEQGITKASEVVGPLILLLGELFEKVRNSTAFQTFKEAVSTSFDNAKQAISDFAQSETWQTIKDTLKDIAQAILDIDFNEVLVGLQDFLDKWGAFIAFWVGAFAVFKTITVVVALFTALGTAIAFLTSPIGVITVVITALIAIGIALWKNWDTVKEKAQELGTKISEVWNSIKDAVTNAANTVKSVVTNIWNAIKSVTSSVWNGIRSTISSILSGIRSTFTNIFNGLRNIVSNAFNGVRTAVSSGMNRALSAVTNMFSRFRNAGRNIVQNIADGISGAIGKVTGAISNVTQKIRDFLPFSPPKDKSSPLVDIHKNGIGEQIAKGIHQGEFEVRQAMHHMLEMPDINRFIPQFGTANVGGSTTTTNINKNYNSYDDKDVIELLRRIADKDNKIYLDTNVLVGRTIDKIDSKLGNRAALAERGLGF